MAQRRGWSCNGECVVLFNRWAPMVRVTLPFPKRHYQRVVHSPIQLPRRSAHPRFLTTLSFGPPHLYLSTPQRLALTTTIVVMRFSMCSQALVESWTAKKHHNLRSPTEWVRSEISSPTWGGRARMMSSETGLTRPFLDDGERARYAWSSFGFQCNLTFVLGLWWYLHSGSPALVNIWNEIACHLLPWVRWNALFCFPFSHFSVDRGFFWRLLADLTPNHVTAR